MKCFNLFVFLIVKIGVGLFCSCPSISVSIFPSVSAEALNGAKEAFYNSKGVADLSAEACQESLRQLSSAEGLDAEHPLGSEGSSLMRNTIGFYQTLDYQRSALTKTVSAYVQAYLCEVTSLCDWVETGDDSVELQERIEVLRNPEELNLLIQAATNSFIALDESLSKAPQGHLIDKAPPSYKMLFEDRRVRATEKIRAANNIAVVAQIHSKIAEIFLKSIAFSGRRSCVDKYREDRVSTLQADIEMLLSESSNSQSTISSQKRIKVIGLIDEQESDKVFKMNAKKCQLMSSESSSVYRQSIEFFKRSLEVEEIGKRRFNEVFAHNRVGA